MPVFSFDTFFFLLYQFLRNGDNVNPSLYSYNWQKFNNKMNEKKNQKYQSIDPEYVTWQIYSRILKILLRQFCPLIFVPS